jgi:hypothetical protein
VKEDIRRTSCLPAVPISLILHGLIDSYRLLVHPASAGRALTMEVEETRGMDDQKPTVITNPPLAAVTQPIRQARSGDVCYSDAWVTAFSGRNGFVTEFRYSA